MAEDGQAERRLGDEDVAGHRLERRAGRIGPALVVARDDDPLAGMLEHDLGRAEDMAGGDEADVDLAEPDRLAIGDRPRLSAARSGTSMIASVSGVAQTSLMAAAGMIGMAVGDERDRLWAARDRSRRRPASRKCLRNRAMIQEPRRAIDLYMGRQ